MIYVFGESVQMADGYAVVNDLPGARCFGNGSRSTDGMLREARDAAYGRNE